MINVSLITSKASFIGIANMYMRELAKELHRKFVLAPGAPISSICWYTNNPSTETYYRDKYLSVRIYTILNANTRDISELSFEGEDGWDGDAASVGAPPYTTSSQPPRYSSVAACRDTKGAKERPICVFYQPSAKVIDLKSMAPDNNVVVGNVEDPKGIPTSR